jgi:hypothetical protein
MRSKSLELITHPGVHFYMFSTSLHAKLSSCRSPLLLQSEQVHYFLVDIAYRRAFLFKFSLFPRHKSSWADN